MSALALMAAKENHRVKLGERGPVILSGHPIPGNETNVSRVIGGLHRAGADVIHSGLAHVHVSGHAAQEALKFLLNLVQPDFFVPVHGEYRHLVHHARLARSTGMADDHVFVCEDGDSLVLGPEGIDVERRYAPAGYLYVDGVVGDMGRGVLRDRRALAKEGIVVVIVTLDAHTGEVVTGPEIVTRGWVHAPEAEELLEEAKEAVLRSLRGHRRERPRHRDPQAPCPQRPVQVHQRADEAPPHRRARRDGGLTRPVASIAHRSL